MLIKRLQATAPDHKGELWKDYEALYKGGHEFRERIESFLPARSHEARGHYDKRKATAVYRSYIGTVVDYFAALLFAHELTTTPTRGDGGEEAEAPEWAADFEPDCDGSGANLLDFIRDAFVDALIKRTGLWRLDFPDSYGSSPDRATADRNGATDVRLARVKREQLLDCERDERGRLLWAVVHKGDRPRATPDDERNTTRHRWWVLTRKTAARYEAFVKDGEQLSPESDIRPVAEVTHNLGEVPLISLDVGDGLWVANRLESAQLEHFRLSSANGWSMRQTCYAMPLYKVEDPQSWRPPKHGAGFYLALGKDEDGGWMAPPTAHIEAVQAEVKAQKDEVFRLVSQMSLGVDNNAAAVGRSAESKAADAEAIQVVLRAYGSKVRDALKLTLELLSKARGDDLSWVVEGLDRFETLDPDVLIELLETALAIDIPSNAFKVEAKVRAALALLPGLDKATRDQIREEITEGVEDEEDDEEIEPDSSHHHGAPDDVIDDDDRGSQGGDAAALRGRGAATQRRPPRRTARGSA